MYEIYFGKIFWGLTHQNPCLFFQLLHEFLFLLNSQSYRTTTYKKKHAMHCRLHVKYPTALPVKQKHTNLKNRWYIVTHVSYDSWMVLEPPIKIICTFSCSWKMNVANYSGIKSYWVRCWSTSKDNTWKIKNHWITRSDKPFILKYKHQSKD